MELNKELRKLIRMSKALREQLNTCRRLYEETYGHSSSENDYFVDTFETQLYDKFDPKALDEAAKSIS